MYGVPKDVFSILPEAAPVGGLGKVQGHPALRVWGIPEFSPGRCENRSTQSLTA